MSSGPIRLVVRLPELSVIDMESGERRLIAYLEKRLQAIKLRRAEAEAEVEERKRQLRMAQGALLLIDEQCDEEEAFVHLLLASLPAEATV